MFVSAADLTSLFLIAVLCSVILVVNSLWLYCDVHFDSKTYTDIQNTSWLLSVYGWITISNSVSNSDKILTFVLCHVTSLLTSLNNCQSRLDLLYDISALLSYMSWANPFLKKSTSSK